MLVRISPKYSLRVNYFRPPIALLSINATRPFRQLKLTLPARNAFTSTPVFASAGIDTKEPNIVIETQSPRKRGRPRKTPIPQSISIESIPQRRSNAQKSSKTGEGPQFQTSSSDPSLLNDRIEVNRESHESRTEECTSKKWEARNSKLPILLALNWDDSRDPTGWWMSEKYDGFRAFWDGEYLWSKQGKLLPAPESFTRLLPRDAMLDGEVWYNRDNFQETLARMHSSWEDLRYSLFDIPSSRNPIEERLVEIEAMVKRINSPQIDAVVMTKCTAIILRDSIDSRSGSEHLHTFLDEVEANRGEGVMLRQPGSLYQTGRSTTLCKKFADMEVKFLQLTPKVGYNSLQCETPWGRVMNVNCTMADYRFPPPANSVVTVRYSGKWKSGLPKYPFLMRPRPDLQWEDVVNEYKELQRAEDLMKE